ncbi:hypothetical protein BIFADO_01857 [Bifidobacterium adolescentis L2-32]|uniref:Uncharacterized protein n=1 Tax=Bifidobacterium adolescentis L2-32 TaxID=411481 RepID=A7A7L9_BIFAD|nr:hypothetical protein BIFADO_01857 [Bifidobacterium adolescentis L2-32]
MRAYVTPTTCKWFGTDISNLCLPNLVCCRFTATLMKAKQR